MQKKPKVAIIMGSDSDFPIVKNGVKLLKENGVDVVLNVMSAHRTPDLAADFAKNAKANGIEVIIGAAGKAAHLPGVLAAFTTLPVIGLPILSSTLDGLDSLLSIVQMPKGIPVATVAINGAENAAILALQILAVKYNEIAKLLENMKIDMAKQVEKKNQEIKLEAEKLWKN